MDTSQTFIQTPTCNIAKCNKNCILSLASRESNDIESCKSFAICNPTHKIELFIDLLFLKLLFLD